MGNNNFLLLAIILAGIIGGYVYHTNMPPELLISPATNTRPNDLSNFADIDINFSSGEVERMNKFITFGQYPIVPEPGGNKRNIFAPF